VLGYVNYQYPLSIYGAFGKVVVSLGPLVTGFFTIYFLSPPILTLLYNPEVSYSFDLNQFIHHADIIDWLMVYVLTCVCFHTLPSSQDFKVALQGSLPVGIVSYLVIAFLGINSINFLASTNHYLQDFSRIMLVGIFISLPATIFAIFGYVGLILKKLLYKFFKRQP
jgi:hypothetical protein